MTGTGCAVQTRTCASCRWFDGADLGIADDTDLLGRCGWPASELPFSLRYGGRERLLVLPTDGAACRRHEIGREIGPDDADEPPDAVGTGGDAS